MSVTTPVMHQTVIQYFELSFHICWGYRMNEYSETLNDLVLPINASQNQQSTLKISSPNV